MKKPKKNYNKNVYKTLIIHALYGNKFKSAEELANELGILKRTVNSRLKEISKSDKIKMDKKGVFYRIPYLERDFLLTGDDIDRLYNTCLFHSIEDVLSEKLVYLIGMFLDSKKHLLGVKNNKEEFRDYLKEVSIIKKAIREKKKINIINYKDRDNPNGGTSGGITYKGVIPVKLDEHLNKIYCFDLKDHKRCFNLERMSNVQSTKLNAGNHIEWNPDDDLDVFGFLPKSEFEDRRFKIVMRLTNFAYSLLIRQFPAIDNSTYVKKAPKRSKKPYVLIVETNDPYALARFFAGIASEVEISSYKNHATDPNARALIDQWFNRYVKEGLERQKLI
jgi:hypothetical protein